MTIDVADVDCEGDASDLTPELLAAGSARPDAQGLDVDWIEAAAEHLPFDGSYDVACPRSA